MTTRESISAMYAAFNRRDVDATFAHMGETIDWPKASEGGRVVGKREIREYWARQWAEFDPRVDVLDVVDHEDGTVAVTVRQLVKNTHGDVLSDTEVRHVYTFANGLIERMDVEDGAGTPDGPSTAFSAGA